MNIREQLAALVRARLMSPITSKEIIAELDRLEKIEKAAREHRKIEKRRAADQLRFPCHHAASGLTYSSSQAAGAAADLDAALKATPCT